MTASDSSAKCEECGAILPEGKLCGEYLEEMIKWDFEDFLGVGQIHHLTVLCYYLQHPSLYSREGLADGKDFLREFVVKDVSFSEHDARNRERLSSSVRDWKIKGTPENHGAYAAKPAWEMTAKDIVEAGLGDYVGNVKKWSRSVYASLEKSGNLN